MQRFISSVIVLILFLSCGTYRTISVSDSVPVSHSNEIKELSTYLEKVVNAGGNHYRKKAIVNQLEEFGLKEQTISKRIDWLSVQKNIVVNVQGKSDSLIYIVAHYDKTDINPLKLASVFLNGLLDPLISWSYTSQGAIDNATGVSVALQLAKSLSKKENHYSYRILFSGSEESGLRGSRAHVARLKPEEFYLIKFVINIDVVGVKEKQNCVYMLSDDDLEKKALKI
ncbi:MAG: M28 family peptidase, partial [Flavobacteriaceae bacterium]